MLADNNLVDEAMPCRDLGPSPLWVPWLHWRGDRLHMERLCHSEMGISRADGWLITTKCPVIRQL